MIQAKVGQYYYTRFRRHYGVWVYDYVGKDGGTSAQHVEDFWTREEARQFVWKMNGWGTPKKALKN